MGILLLAIAGCEKGSSRPEGDARIRDARNKPNIILLTIDALRADQIGAYGHPGHLTPMIDAIASEGVVFEQCVAASPWTLPSISSMFCSYYPGVHKATIIRVIEDAEQGRTKKVPVFDKENQFATIPEFLHEIGYATAGISANPFIQQEYGFGAGFDFWDGSFAENTVPGRRVNKAAIRWLEGRQDQDQPFFLYLHYMDVHGPYDAEPRFLDPLVEMLQRQPGPKLTQEEFSRLNAYIRKPPKNDSHPELYESLRMYRWYWKIRYGAGVREMDHYIGELVAYFERRGLWDEIYVILTADHGEAFCEHGHWEHGFSQFQTDLHVPLVLRWAGVLPAGMRVPNRARLMDLFPTLVDQLGSSALPGLQGETLMPLILDQPRSDHRRSFAEAYKGATDAGYDQKAIFDGPWKLIRAARPPPAGATHPPEPAIALFHLVNDPGERHNRADSEPGVVAELLALLEQQIAENLAIKPGVVSHERSVPDSTSRRLESLGYVGEQDATSPESR